MNVNQKGVKGLIKVIEDLTDKGFYVFPAFDDHSPVDLVCIGPDGKCIRLQIKYREKMPNVKAERYELHARSIVNGKVVPIDRSMIDGWAIYMQDRNIVKYVPVNAMEGKNQLHINPDEQYGELAEWLKAPHC